MRRKPKENNFKVCWGTEIRPHYTWCLSALSSDLELWSYQLHPWVIYCTYYALLGIVAVRLGPGQLWDCHLLKALTVIPMRDTCDIPLSPLKIPLWQQANIVWDTVGMLSVRKHDRFILYGQYNIQMSAELCFTRRLRTGKSMLILDRFFCSVFLQVMIRLTMQVWNFC